MGKNLDASSHPLEPLILPSRSIYRIPLCDAPPAAFVYVVSMTFASADELDKCRKRMHEETFTGAGRLALPDSRCVCRKFPCPMGRRYVQATAVLRADEPTGASELLQPGQGGRCAAVTIKQTFARAAQHHPTTAQERKGHGGQEKSMAHRVAGRFNELLGKWLASCYVLLGSCVYHRA